MDKSIKSNFGFNWNKNEVKLKPIDKEKDLKIKSK